MSYGKILGTITILVVFAVLLSFVVACAPTPIDVRTNVNCPQPAAEALSAPEPLPQVPPLDGSDPASVIGKLSETLAADVKPYEDEKSKRRALIDHGVRLCGWTR